MTGRQKTSIQRQIEELRKVMRDAAAMDARDTELRLAIQMDEIIKDRKLSCREVARRMKTSASHLNRLMAFEVSPTLETLHRFAVATHCRLRVQLVPIRKRGEG